MKKRTAEDFIQIVKREIKKAPKDPVRIDIEPDEILNVREACEALNRESKKKLSWAWTNNASNTRIAFLGPDRPRPLKIIETSLGWLTDDDRAAANEEWQRLRKKYPDHHVEFVLTGSRNRFEVWRGEEYLKVNRALLTDLELAYDYLNLAIYESRIDSQRAWARAAAENRLRKQYQDIVNAFTEYKKRNPKHTYTAAERNIADKMKMTPKSLGRIINRRSGTSPAKWYSTL